MSCLDSFGYKKGGQSPEIVMGAKLLKLYFWEIFYSD